MNDQRAQTEEIEALEAIYGDALAMDSPAGAKCATFTITLSDGEARLGDFKITFPQDYPSKSCPVFEIRSEYLRTPSDLEKVAKSLTEIFVPGEVVVFQWIELLKEYLMEKTAVSRKESKQSDSIEKSDQELSNCAQHSESWDECDTQKDPFSHQPAQKDLKMSQPVAIPDIMHGEPLTDRKNTFQAHVAEVHSKDEVSVILCKLKENRKVAMATHNIMAYRIHDGKKQVYIHDCDDDGESAAGSRLLHLLELMDVCNAVVIVTRWYGGIHLGPDRFKHINTCARTLIQETGIGLQHKKLKPMKGPGSSASSKSQGKKP